MPTTACRAASGSHPTLLPCHGRDKKDATACCPALHPVPTCGPARAGALASLPSGLKSSPMCSGTTFGELRLWHADTCMVYVRVYVTHAYWECSRSLPGPQLTWQPPGSGVNTCCHAAAAGNSNQTAHLAVQSRPHQRPGMPRCACMHTSCRLGPASSNTGSPPAEHSRSRVAGRGRHVTRSQRTGARAGKPPQLARHERAVGRRALKAGARDPSGGALQGALKDDGQAPHPLQVRALDIVQQRSQVVDLRAAKPWRAASVVIGQLGKAQCTLACHARWSSQAVPAASQSCRRR